LVPLLVLLLVVRWQTIYWYAWQSQPRLPVNAAEQQWVTFSGAEMRLVKFEQATDLLGSGNKPLVLPAGLMAWRAVIEFDAPDQDAILGCAISLEDSQNRLYGTSPSELALVRGQSVVSCSKLSDEDSSEYATTALFVTPTGVDPVAVQIRWELQLPRYVRFDIRG
jgi:hypothetical protein